MRPLKLIAAGIKSESDRTLEICAPLNFNQVPANSIPHKPTRYAFKFTSFMP